MDRLEALKKKDKGNEWKIEKILNDVKSFYLLSAIELKLINNNFLMILNSIENMKKK